MRWLGFDWHDKLFYASDYFEQLYDYAVLLIQQGSAYVDSLSADDIRRYRGTLTEPGKDSPYRGRSVEDNLDLFRRMRAGEFPDGASVLRAKIDMSSPNINLRDPTVYRIRHVAHHRSGTAWNIYPTYDFAHPLSDAIEGITHSICTLEFEDHRPLYDWLLDRLHTPHHPQQIEFARLNLTQTVMSKRKLLELVGAENRSAAGTIPAFPTIKGLRAAGDIRPSRSGLFASISGWPSAMRPIEMPLARLFFCSRGFEPDERGEWMARASAFKSCDRELTQKSRSSTSTPSIILRTRAWERGRFRSHESSTSNRTIFANSRRRSFIGSVPDKKCGCDTRIFIRCTTIVKDERTGEIMEVRCTYDPATRSAHRRRKGAR